MSGRLTGKVATVTGAASGIGRAAARGFAAEGASVALLGLDDTQLNELAAELGPDHLAALADVRVESEVAKAFADIRDRYGRLDILLNCAGIQLIKTDAPVDRLDLGPWQQTLDTNLTGLFLTCKHGVRLMLSHRSGSVINCGSPTGMSGRGWEHHAYSASKGGVHALTKAMAVAYGPHGIRANCLVPGATETPMTSELFGDEDRVERIRERSALGRLGKPSDLVGAAVFLASDESAFVTGAMLVVDGGVNVT